MRADHAPQVLLRDLRPVRMKSEDAVSGTTVEQSRQQQHDTEIASGPDEPGCCASHHQRTDDDPDYAVCESPVASHDLSFLIRTASGARTR